MKKPIPQLLLFLTAGIWGLAFVLMKTATDTVPVYALLALRFTGAFLILGAVFFKKMLRIKLRDLFAGFTVALTIFLAYVTQTFGLLDTTPGKNAFFTAVYCIIVPFLFWITDKKRPDKFHLISAALCLVGVALVSLESGAFSFTKGDALTLLCSLFYAMQIVAVAKFCQTSDPAVITVLQFGFAGAFCWIAHALFENGIPALGPDVLWQLVFLTVFSTALAFLMQNIGQKYANPSSAALILSLEAVFGVLFSILFGFEKPSARILLGFAVIFIAVVISETKLSFLTKRKR